MKFCPVCQTRFDDEILRFCTNDGASLVDENPSFTEMPSDSGGGDKADDIGEPTVIRRNAPPAPTVQNAAEQSINPAQRIVVPTYETEREPVRAKVLPAPVKPPLKSNTALVVLATMLGTFAVLAVLGGVWYILSGRGGGDSNKNITVNTNPPVVNLNVNTNFSQDNTAANFNFNTNANENANANANIAANINVKTPTPTPTRTPTPTATPVNANVNSNANFNLGNTNVMSRPTQTPTASPSPTTQISPSPTATATPPAQNVNAGVMNSRAVSLTKPAYPQSAKQVNASGEVRVQIVVDELGNVTSAKAVSGNRVLWSPAENAARQSRFNPVKVGNRAVPATGVVVYNFINQ